MLSIGKLRPGGGEYYVREIVTSAEDYYLGHGEAPGRWVGSLAAEMGLHGEVDPEHFRALLDGRHPLTAEQLVDPPRLSFLLLDGTITLGVFTGGSLIVGSAARTDLLGIDRAEELARAQYASMHRLAELPDATPVWPTHGAGSFCSAPPGAARITTIAIEKATNPLLRAPNADAFVADLLGSLGSYPAYFDRLGEVNRRGPAVIADDPHLPQLSLGQVHGLVGDGALIVDVRPVTDVAAAHVPGSLAIPLREQFATWLGWLVEPATLVIIIRNPEQPVQDIVWGALNVGVEHLTGELAGGMNAWVEAGEPVATTALVRPDQVHGTVLDIRQDIEYSAGHVPGALHVELAHLPANTDTAPAGPTVLMCGHGERALTAATVLERSGRTDLSVLVGGPDDWATAAGRSLEGQP